MVFVGNTGKTSRSAGNPIATTMAETAIILDCGIYTFTRSTQNLPWFWNC